MNKMSNERYIELISQANELLDKIDAYWDALFERVESNAQAQDIKQAA